MLYRSANFLLLDITASLLVFSSALHGKTARRRRQLFSTAKELSSAGKDEVSSDEVTRKSDLMAILFRPFVFSGYFAMMMASISLFKSHPLFMIFVQHIAIVLFIIVAFLQWFKPCLALCLGGLFSIIWLVSAYTTFRWILNDVVVALFSLLVSHVRFQNFPSLQMFLCCLLYTSPSPRDA